MTGDVAGAKPLMLAADEWPDPLHEISAPKTYWSTVNLAEAIPGVPTPMNWSIFGCGTDLSVPRAYHRLGVLPRAQLGRAERVDGRIAGIFYGRAAMNVTRLRQIADLTPGTSGDAMERQFLGSVRTGVPDGSSMRRLPFVAVRFPTQAVRLPGMLRRLHVEQHRWWRAHTVQQSSAPPVELLRAAAERFDLAMGIHAMAIAVSQACFEQLTRLAEEVGDPSFVARLSTGYGGFEEAGMIESLWKLARGELDMDAFITRYGFHGPDEGEVSSASWRENPEPVRTLARRYAERGREDGERERARRTALRQEAQRELSALLPAWQRPRARAVLGLAARYLPLREIGKAAFLMAIDVTRFAARRHGEQLAGSGVLAARDDIFYFTVPEVLRGLPADLAEQIAARRRASRAEYLNLELPDRWAGMPVPVLRHVGPEVARAGDRISGISVTNGTVQGRVRIGVNLEAAEDLEPDEILVCEVTDPSWCALFPLVSGMIVDVGGPLSHAAIVAREMDIPCVINTKDAATRLRTGMLVRLDAADGMVTVLEAAQEPDMTR